MQPGFVKRATMNQHKGRPSRSRKLEGCTIRQPGIQIEKNAKRVPKLKEFASEEEDDAAIWR